jgi:hypothetical protein
MATLTFSIEVVVPNGPSRVTVPPGVEEYNDCIVGEEDVIATVVPPLEVNNEGVLADTCQGISSVPPDFKTFSVQRGERVARLSTWPLFVITEYYPDWAPFSLTPAIAAHIPLLFNWYASICPVIVFS